MVPYDSPQHYWDCRFVVCDDAQAISSERGGGFVEGITLRNPRATSKPVADAMLHVF